MTKKALIYGGTDGHGVVMTILSERNLKAEGYETETICEYIDHTKISPADLQSRTSMGTGVPIFFWGITFRNIPTDTLKPGDRIVIVDIPLPEPDNRLPDYSPEETIQTLSRITRAGVDVIIIDHHKSSLNGYGDVIQAGGQVIISSSAVTTHYGPPDAFTTWWGRIAAISDRDRAVLPVTEEEENQSALLDKATRKDLPGIMQAIRDDNREYLKSYNPDISKYQDANLYENVIYIPSLEKSWGFKQLSKACTDHDKDYAIGCTSDENPVILAVTNWKHDAVPVALMLGLTRFRGHGEAVSIDPEEISRRDCIRRLEMTYPGASDKRTPHYSQNSFYSIISAFMRQIDIPYFLTIHGWEHIEHVIAYARTLGSLFALTEEEQKILDWSSLLHDIGNGAAETYGISEEQAREEHHEYSFRMIHDWHQEGRFAGFLTDEEVGKIAELCRRHRKKCPLPADPTLSRLCILLKIADALDMDKRRAQKNDKGTYYHELQQTLPEESDKHYRGHLAIDAIRVHASERSIVFELITNNEEDAAIQKQFLTQEISILKTLCDVQIQSVKNKG